MSSLWHKSACNPTYISPQKSRQCRVCRVWKKRIDLYYESGEYPICKPCYEYSVIKCSAPDCENRIPRCYLFKCMECPSLICRWCYEQNVNLYEFCSSCNKRTCCHTPAFTEKCKTCSKTVCKVCANNKSHCKLCLTVLICRRLNPDFPRDCIKIIQAFVFNLNCVIPNSSQKL